ncbi:hypothetical protein CMU94_02090 [Elizabethkingia anophelis]|nr:hypothetical protein [Elizabethkingia anophelis]
MNSNFSRKIWWKIQRHNNGIEKKKFEVVNKNGVKKYNFLIGESEQVKNIITERLNELGWTFPYFQSQMYKKYRTLKKDSERYLKGEMSIPIFEFFNMMEVLNIEISLKPKDNLFTSSYERGIVIINRNYFPRFYLSFPLKKVTEFHIHFQDNLEKNIKNKSLEYYTVMHEAIRWYFTGKKNVYKPMDLKREFMKQYFQNDQNILFDTKEIDRTK